MISLTRRHSAVLATLTAVAAAALPSAAQAAPIVSPHASAGDLYVATAGGGSLTPTGHGGDTYRLRLDHPGQAITSFADHPGRVADDTTPKALVDGWKADGFEADPPNAALVVNGAPADHDVMVVELTKPQLTKSGALTFDAKRIPAPKDGALKAFAPRADRSVATHFGGASLFIDNGANVVPVTLNVTMPANSVAMITPRDGFALAPGAGSPTTLISHGPIDGSLQSNTMLLRADQVTSVTETVGMVDGAGPLAIDANYINGASATISVNGGAAQPLPSGNSTIPVS
jgi:hypothetical protein